MECNTSADCTPPFGCGSDHACSSIGDAGIATDAAGTDAGLDATPIDDAASSDAAAIADVGHDAFAVDTGMPATWQLLPSSSWPLDGGFSDYTRAPNTSFYALAGNTSDIFGRFDIPTQTWTMLAAPPETGIDGAARGLAGPAWVGSALYVMYATNVHRYDIAANTWTALAAVAQTVNAQNATDDAGHVYAITMDRRVATYDIASDTVRYQPLGVAVTPAVPRLAWDPGARRLFVVPTLESPDMYSFDPATGTVAPLASLLGATTFAPLFCGDRAGHLYGTTNTVGDAFFWRYDIATNTWSSMPDLPFPHNQNGECTVSDDGYLYVAADQPSMARIRVR